MNFLAIDVETANADFSSICQIGIVEFENGQQIDSWITLVNPESYFDEFNISIHGITEMDVKDAPTFDVVYDKIKEKISNKITIHHMPFDKVAITRACLEYNLEVIEAQWLDSARIVRRTWEQFARSGYGLASIAHFLQINFKHHDALQDAHTAALVVNEACKKTSVSIDEWLIKVNKPISSTLNQHSTLKIEGNPNGSLFGENIVFTGALYLPRKEAAFIAAEIGCNVDDSVSKKTTILVVGTQDSDKLAGYEKSSKHRKAEELINKGINIKIITEKDFIEICNNENNALLPAEVVNKPKNIKSENDGIYVLNINLDDGQFLEKINEIEKLIDNLTPAQIFEINKKKQERELFLNSIKDCKHELKRRLAEVSKMQLDKIEINFGLFDKEVATEDELDLLSSINFQTEEIEDVLYDLMKNKLSLKEYFEIIEVIIENIQSELDEMTASEFFLEIINSTINNLEYIKNEILKSSKG